MSDKMLMDCWMKDKKAQFICRIILIACVAIALSGYCIWIYQNKVIPEINRGEYTDSYRDYQGLAEIGEVDDSKEYIQEIYVEGKKLSAIDLHTNGYADNDVSTMIVKLRDASDQTIIEEWERKSCDMTNSLRERFVLSESLLCEGKRKLEIVITSEGAAPGESFTFYIAEEDLCEGNFTENGTVKDMELEYVLNYGEPTITKQFIKSYYWCIMIPLVLLVIGLMAVLFFKKEYKIENLFLVTTLVLGIIYLFVLPPFTAPDEPGHYSTAYIRSNSILGQADMSARNCDAGIAFSYLLSSDTYRIIAEQGMKGSADTAYGSEIDIQIYNPTYSIQYLPQTLGILIAKIFHMNEIQMLFMGQIFNLAFYMLCVYFAIRLLPFGKMLMMLISMLPMLLSLITSFSYDTVIIALSFLFFSYVMYLIYDKDKIGWKELVVLVVLFVLLLPCKLVYATEGLLIFFIPKEKITVKLPKWVWAVGGILFVAGAVYVVKQFWPSIQSMFGGGDNAQNIIYNGSEGYSLGYIMKNPIRSILFFVKSLLLSMFYYAASMVGAYLGWLNIYTPTWCMVGYLLLLLLVTFLCCNERENVLNIKKRIVLFVAAAVSCLLTIAVMWLSWTPLDAVKVQGVQGRYFLPVLPMLLLSICGNKKWKSIHVEREVISLAAIMQVFVVVSILMTGFVA